MQSLWMLFAAFLFSIMGACVKLSAEFYSVPEIVMYRSLIGVLFIAGLIYFQGGTLKTRYPWRHLWRSVVGTTAFSLWFYSLTELPMATAMTLNYMSPIWIAAVLFVLGWWRGEAKLAWTLVGAILFSFIGVVLLLRPEFDREKWLPAVIGLVAGFLSAQAYLQVKKLGMLGEPDYRVVFYFTLTGVIAGFVGALFTPQGVTLVHAHSGKGILLLLGTGLTATMAQIALTRAYRLGNTLVTANLQYSGIVFSSIWGVLIWGDRLSWEGWAGIVIILISGSIATWFNSRKATVPVTDAPPQPDTQKVQSL